MSLRKIIFWLHLVAGLVAGTVILIMSATGVALAFEKEIVAWAERDVRRIKPPLEAKRLPLDDLLAKVRQERPDVVISGVTVQSDPTVGVLMSAGRTNNFYLNPYTGVVQPQGAAAVRAFMQTMIEWHRYLGRREGQRPIGKAITGACTGAFCFLAVSGLYLWWPRQWTRGALRSVTLFNSQLRGKARDWNWHNVIGFWSAPVLIVLTATAMPISYQWAGNLIYKITGTQAVPPGGGNAVTLPSPPAGTKALSYEALFAVVQEQAPHWQQINLRLGGGGPRGGGEGRSREREQNTTRPEARGRERGEENRRGSGGVTFAIRQQDGSPRFATAQLTLNPFTGEVLRAEKFSDYNLGRQVRSWTRFLHTGEALGSLGQFLAGLASLGGVVLVYTGFALAWRRFFKRARSEPSPGEEVSLPVTIQP